MNSLSHFFITGMGRSGTTLLEKLLESHPQMDMFYQPFVNEFVSAKKVFLKKIMDERYYVLNDSPLNSKYTSKEFNQFLEGENFNLNSRYVNFLSLYTGKLDERSKKNNVQVQGSKEILCEEFIEYFTKNNIKSCLVIRDPRDVIASANYPKGEKYLGTKKPTLFLLRLWRKSVEFLDLHKNNENLYHIRYEDLVASPYQYLDYITSFLKLESFDNDYFSDGIKDKNGNLWSSNSSSESKVSFISEKSVGRYSVLLSLNEIAYIEAICHKEMKQHGYDCGNQSVDYREVITNFKDYDIPHSPHLNSDYSSEEENVLEELTRLNGA
jgi:hypothetical protein